MNQILGPRWIMIAYWAAFVLLSLLFHRQSFLGFNAVLTIAMFAGLFGLGAFVATATLPSHQQTTHSRQSAPASTAPLKLSTRVLTLTSIGGSLANLSAAIIALRDSPFSVSDVLSLQGLADSANFMAVARYSGDSDISSVAFILLGIGNAASLASPFIFNTDSRHKVFLTALPAISALAYTAVSSARFGFIVSVALTLGGLLASYIVRHGRPLKLQMRTVLGIGATGIIIAVVFVGVGALRTGDLTPISFQSSIDKQISYTVGSVAAYSVWQERYNNSTSIEHDMGSNSIAGLSYILNTRTTDADNNEFSVIDNRGTTTNVYTSFRSIISDFGIAGTAFIMLLFGAITGILYKFAARQSGVSSALLGFVYAFIFVSGWVPISSYTNVIFSLVACPLIIAAASSSESSSCRRRIQSRKRLRA